MADKAELISHVQDSHAFHFWGGHEVVLPCLGPVDVPAWSFFGLFDVPAFEIKLQLTKFMVIETIAALLMLAIFIPLARRIARGGPPRGKLWNFFEAMLIFLRDQVARPAIGRKDADRFLPFIWTAFFFILFCKFCSDSRRIRKSKN